MLNHAFLKTLFMKVYSHSHSKIAKNMYVHKIGKCAIQNKIEISANEVMNLAEVFKLIKRNLIVKYIFTQRKITKCIKDTSLNNQFVSGASSAIDEYNVKCTSNIPCPGYTFGENASFKLYLVKWVSSVVS